MKHTPSPWHRPGGSTGIYAKNGTMIASCGNRRILASMRQHGHNPLQCGANADLIAKAPELLDAVENLLEAATWALRSAGYEKGEALETLRELSVGRHHLDRLHAAVQKAKDCTLKQAPA